MSNLSSACRYPFSVRAAEIITLEVVTIGKVNKGGPRGKYQEWLTDDGLIKLEGWARDGLIDEQIAKNIGITPSTLYEWKKKYPELSEALKNGKEVIDRHVENALLKRALGYRYDEITRELGEDPSTGEMNLIVTKVVTKEVQPDTTAQIFWLKNRKPNDWRDTPLQQLQAEKLKAETDFAKMRVSKLRGDKKDTSMLQVLLEGQQQFEELAQKGAFGQFEKKVDES